MGKVFSMGARMTLKDNFSGTVSRIAQSTQQFKKNVDSVNKSIGSYRDGMGRLRDEHGRFLSSGEKANVRTKTWIGTNGKLASSFQWVANGIKGAAISFGLIKAKNWLIDSNADMETYRNTLGIVLKDQKKAADMLEWATTFAAQTPFEIPGIVDATTKLTAYGMDAKKTLGIIGDMASAMGKPLEQAIEAIADAQVGELERLKEFSITKEMIEQQAKIMKVTVTNNRGQIVDQKAFNAVLFKLMEDRYKGAMKVQSESFWGMVSNVKDFVFTTLREMGKPLFDKAKEGLGNLLAWMQKLKDSGALQAFMDKVNQIGGTVIGVFGKVRAFTQDVIGKIITKVTSWYDTNKPMIDKIGLAFKTAFKTLSDFATPIIAWLKDVGLPGLVDILGTIGTWVLNIAGWFIDNWGTVGPLIMGVVGAFTAFWTICTIITAGLKAWAAIQAIVNALMLNNPITWIIIAVGLLIGLIVLLIKNWDKVKAVIGTVAKAIGTALKTAWNWVKGIGQSIGDFFVGIWNGIGDAVAGVVSWITGVWQGFKDFFGNLWKGIMEVVKAPVNFLISAINLLVKGLNSISIDIPDWVPLVGGKKFGFQIPEIPYLAKGTNNWKGGPAYMNERGGELAVLPGGSKVIPADKTDKILDKPQRSNITIRNNFNITQQPGEDAESFADRVIEILLEQLEMADEIANNEEMGVLVNG